MTEQEQRELSAYEFTMEHQRNLNVDLYHERTRPSVILAGHLDIKPDGNMWSVLYGSNIAEGVAGFGETPDAAMRDFDRQFCERRAQTTSSNTGGGR